MARKGKKDKLGSYPSFPPHSGSPLLVAAIALAIIAATAFVFHGEARNGFVNYDDPTYVYENPHLRDGLTWDAFRWAFVQQTPDGRTVPAYAAGNFHPLTWLSHMADVSLFGWNPAAKTTILGLTLPVPAWHHLAALALHLANTVLLFLLLRRLTGWLWPAAFAAALFALHPLHVESVSWISERKDLLSTLFFLLTLWAYAAWTQRRSLWRYALILILFALGLMSKPMLVTLPFVLLLLDFWPLGRLKQIGTYPICLHPSPLGEGAALAAGEGLRPTNSARAGTLSKNQKLSTPQSALHDSAVPCSIFDIRRFLPLLLEKLPLFALAAASCVLTWLAQSRSHAVASFHVAPWSFRWQNALIAPVRYLAKTFWPAGLTFSYDRNGFYPADGSIPWFWTAGAAALLLIITALVLLAARRYRRLYPAVGWFWFLGTLVPVIGLVQVGSQTIADRYTYLPLIGLFIIAAGLLAETFHPSPLGEGAALAAGEGLRIRTSVRATPAPPFIFNFSFLIFNFLALAILLALSFTTSTQISTWRDNFSLYSRALETNPRDVKARINLGHEFRARFEAGGSPDLLDRAEEQFRAILDLSPHHPPALANLGLVYADRADLDAAAGRDAPADANRQKALDLLRQAVRYDPASPEAHNSLANAYSKLHDYDHSIPEYSETVRLQPENAFARYNLAHDLYLKALALPPSQKAQAEQLIQQALDHDLLAVRLLTNFAPVHADLGTLYLHLDRSDLALPEFISAVRLDRHQSDALFWAVLIMSTSDQPALRDGPRALRLIDQLLADPGSRPAPPQLLNLRALALAECSRFDEAADLTRRLLAQAQSAHDQSFAAGLQNNLHLFEAHKPLRLPQIN